MGFDEYDDEPYVLEVVVGLVILAAITAAALAGSWWFVSWLLKAV